MARGRKPIAPEIHEASGAYRKNPSRRIENAIKANGRMPEKPDYFDEHESSKWDELVTDLTENGLLSTDCRELLIAYCTAYGGWMRAREMVRKIGQVLVTKGSDGKSELKRNPFSVE